jgi:Single-stranded DNA-specific exonuclease
MNYSSVSGKSWISKDYNSEKANFLKDNFNISEILSKLIAIRNIKIEDVSFFLKPKIKNFLPNPFCLRDMDKAVQRSVEALDKREKIGIFGDYDVDGATSTAILGNYFTHLKHTIEIYIPDRKTEGYGPSTKGFDKLITKGSKLIFTVDCGTLSFDTIEFSQNKSIDVIVLDHHQSESRLPKALSVVNPNRLDDESRLNYLCAAGVALCF